MRSDRIGHDRSAGVPLGNFQEEIKDQTPNTAAAIQRLEEKSGFNMTDLVNVTVSISDLNDVLSMNEIYKKLSPPKPERPPSKVAVYASV